MGTHRLKDWADRRLRQDYTPEGRLIQKRELPRFMALMWLHGGHRRASVWSYVRQFYLALPGERFWWPMSEDRYAWVLGGRPGALRVATLPGIFVYLAKRDGATDEDLYISAQLFGERRVMRP